MHRNDHSGGAWIAGNWPPAWVAYLTGYLKAGGFTDVTFIDAMTHHLDDEQVRARIAGIRPDIVGCTAITPAIYKAERRLQIAKEVNPAIVTVLGGIHGNFMYPQVLTEAPWIDAMVHGEGEQVFLNKYHFVTPIIKPDAMERTELLDRVMNNYRRFYLRKTLFKYPWIRDKVKRRDLLGWLKAFARSGLQRTFYDLGRVGY